MISLRLLLLFCTPLAVACRSQPPSEPARSENARWSGQHGGGTTPTTRALRTVEEWDAFWRQVERNRPRLLDPSREMAVVIQLGEKRTGGYSAEIVGTRVEAGKFIVEYRESAPERGAMVTQELTSPWAVAVVPRSDLPVVFQNVGTRTPSRRDK